MNSKWVIVGLGNPGLKYSGTRHNVGFKVIDQLSKDYGISLQEKDVHVIGRGVIEGVRVVLMKPLTYMNRSGFAVKRIVRKSDIFTDKISSGLIVIQDDIDINIGSMKVKRNGTSGGHRGVESIIQELGTKDFIRVKVGVGRDEDMPVEEYVLTNFKTAEKKLMKDVILNAASAVAVIVTEGVDKAMNKYNRSIIQSDRNQP